MVPWSARSRPAIRFSSVVLPDPDRPVSASISPGSHLEVDAAQRVHVGPSVPVGLVDLRSEIVIIPPAARLGAPGRRGSGCEVAGVLRPDLDVVVDQLEPDPPLQPERGHEVARAAAAARPGRAPRTPPRRCVRRRLRGYAASVSDAVRPSRMATVRRTSEVTAGSCVTTTTVVPFVSFICCSARYTSCDSAVSSSPVGSSQNRTWGSLARATAIASRCCCPPESWAGRRVAVSSM